MRDFMVSLFGSYTPVTYMEYIDAETMHEVVAKGAAGVDWPWVFGALIFTIVLYSLLRIVGCFFKG